VLGFIKNDEFKDTLSGEEEIKPEQWICLQ
jgi:hypothetical protein